MCGYLLNYFIKVILDTTAFWTTESEGVRLSYYAIEGFLSGSFIPLSLMPKLINDSSWFLPFKYFYAFPTEIALGNISQSKIILGLTSLIVLTIISSFTAKHIMSKGIKQYSAVGG